MTKSCSKSIGRRVPKGSLRRLCKGVRGASRCVPPRASPSGPGALPRFDGSGAVAPSRQDDAAGQDPRCQRNPESRSALRHFEIRYGRNPDRAHRPVNGRVTRVATLGIGRGIACAVGLPGSGWIYGVCSGSMAGFDLTMNYYDDFGYRNSLLAGHISDSSVGLLSYNAERLTLTTQSATRSPSPAPVSWQVPTRSCRRWPCSRSCGSVPTCCSRSAMPTGRALR